MGLVRLYRVTGNEQYLNLAKFLLDERGPGPLPPGERANPRGLSYNQAQAKVTEQSEAVGHAVRATYMYSGMVDVAAITGDTAIRDASDRIWESLIKSKLYITGGIGASAGGEAFGKPYELPNLTAYNETCASVGMDYWNHRLFLLHGDAKYIDVMERTLYNGLISGVSLKGDTFFYPNPLESNGRHARQEWFGVACCPGNITRFMASVPGYIYAKRDDTLYVNLFAGGSADVELAGGALKVVQETRYPWDGLVRMTITPDKPRQFTVAVRIPGWARSEPVPSDLYRFLDTNVPPATLSVNGTSVPLKIDKGYVAIARAWRAGDVVELNLPMPVRRIVANQQVEADRDRVALQRGPIVYAAEWPDNAELARAQPRDPGREPPRVRVPEGSPQRRQRDQGTVRRPGVRREGRGEEGRPGLRRDSVCDVGQPRERRDDRVAAADGSGRQADALSNARHDGDGDRVRAGAGPRQEPEAYQRRRGAQGVRRPVVLFRLVAHAQQQGRVGRDDVCEAVDRVVLRGLLVRRHGPRAGSRAGVMAYPLQGWRPVEAGRGVRPVWRRARRVQHRDLQAGHDRRAEDRSRHAGELVGGTAGVEGEITREVAMEIDRRSFLATLGAASAVELLSADDKADELEHHMMQQLDEAAARRGAGSLFVPSGTGEARRLKSLAPMPERATLVDFFKHRFAPATHVLQSATDALKKGQKEETVLACLLHDVVLNLIKVDHGWWGAQLVEPYVSEKVTWAIRYHQCLRFYPDASVGYEYPEMYNRIFGKDYVPQPHIKAAYDYARKHKWYMEARLVTGTRPVCLQPGHGRVAGSVHRHHRPSLQAAEGRTRG